MIRTFLIGFLVFLVPFFLYALALFVARKNPLTGASWRALDVAVLTVVGLVLSVGLFALGFNFSGGQISGRNTAGQVEQERR
jgi:energy-coupling factor transporter transmembrane protein EcfT